MDNIIKIKEEMEVTIRNIVFSYIIENSGRMVTPELASHIAGECKESLILFIEKILEE